MNPYDDPVADATGGPGRAPTARPNQGSATWPAERSGLALASMISALVSPVFVCLCGLSLLPAVVAIVTGHLALAKIAASAGRLVGRGQALAGLIIGYPMLLISLAMMFLMGNSLVESWQRGERDAAAARGGTASFASNDQRLRAAELQVASASGGDGAYGNTLEAKQLARAYSEKFKLMRETLFTTERKRVFSLSQGEFIVHCELHADRCAFIVHVPSYRKFSDDAKQALADIGWSIAAAEAAKQLAPGDRLAVGLRGTLLYGAIMTGEVPAEGRSVDFTQGEREQLLEFFPPSALATAEQPAMPELSAPEATMPETVMPEARTPDFSMPELARRESDMPDFTLPDPPAMPRLPRPAMPGFSPPGMPGAPPPTIPGGFAALPAGPSIATKIPRPPRPERTQPRIAQPKPESTNMTVEGLEIHPLCEFPDLGWTVKCLAYSPDGRYLAAGKLDRSVLMFDLSSQVQIGAANKVSESQVEAVSFSPDGGLLFVATGGGEAQMHSVNDSGGLGEAKLLFRYSRSADWILPSGKSNFVISGGDRGTTVWQTYGNSAGAERSLKLSDRKLLAASLPSSGVEAMATDGRDLVYFDLRTSQQTKTFNLAGGGTQAAAFSADGKRLAVSAGREITIYDTQNGQALGGLAKQTKETQWSVLFHPNGRWLISGGRGKAYLWDIQSSEHLATIDLGNVLYISALAFSQDGRSLAAIPNAAAQTLRVFRLGGSRLEQTRVP